VQALCARVLCALRPGAGPGRAARCLTNMRPLFDQYAAVFFCQYALVARHRRASITAMTGRDRYTAGWDRFMAMSGLDDLPITAMISYNAMISDHSYDQLSRYDQRSRYDQL
jgi:hypothetical protein